VTKDEIYSVFDGGDPETALMKLAVSFPGFGLRDLEGVLRTLAWSKGDYAFSGPAAPSGVTFSSAGLVRDRARDALRTVFFVMFRTGAWDGEILFQPDFLPFVREVKEGLARMCRASGWRDGRTSDMYEAFAEMEDRLVEKIRLRPEGLACLG
jgi:hypothetical protein